MSNPFDRPSGPTGPDGPQRPGGNGGSGGARPATASRRPGALVITAIVLVLAFMLLSAFASFWTERLWFGSVGYQEVFTTLLLTRIGLFFVFAGLMAAVVAVAMAMAYRYRPVLWPGMPGMPDDGMDRYRQLLAPRMGWVIGGAAAVMGLFAGASASGQWRSYSLWRHSKEFGTTDPYFNKDVGFYVFDLPFWHYIVDFVMALAVVGLIASLLMNYLFGGIRLSARPGERLTSAAQIQVSALLALFVLAKAVDYWLDRFDLVTNSGSIFTGMGYTDDKAVLPAKEILAGIAIVCALLFLANIWRRTWLLPSVGVALFALSAIILGLIVPTLVQAIRVNPNVPDREGPYIKANIDATRAAYQLDQIDVRDVGGTAVPADGELETLDDMTDGIPLVDPQIVSEIFEQQQQVRAYYSVPNVLDVDRYEIDGTDRAVVLGVRELDQSGLAEGDQNWSNLHTAYTHGNGVIAAYANQRPEDDSVQQTGIQWAEGQEADEDALTRLAGEDGYETRVYFGEQSPTYSIVGQRPGGAPVEFDLPRGDRSEDEVATTYDGAGRRPDRQHLQPAALRGALQRAQPAAVEPRARELEDPLRPQPAPDGREGRPVADRRLRPLPGRGGRADPVDPRRLHGHRQVPALPAGVAGGDDRRLAAGEHRLPDAADRRDQLPPQLGEGHGRRVRRHGDPLRVGRGGPDPPGVEGGLP